MHGKEVRDECLAPVKHDLLYNVAMENREFADLLFTLITTDSDRHCIYTGLWTGGLRQRLGEGLSSLQTKYTKRKLEEWGKIGLHWADIHSGSTKSVRVEIPRS